MTDVPKYTLAEAVDAKNELVCLVEFAFYTALSDLTDDGWEISVGPVTGGMMVPYTPRRKLMEALVERLLYDPGIVLYPLPEAALFGATAPSDSEGRSPHE